MISQTVAIPMLLAGLGGLLFLLPDDEEFAGALALSRFKSRAALSRDTTRVKERLAKLGDSCSYETFRTRQITISIAAGLLGVLLGFAVSSSAGTSLLLGVIMACTSYFYVDRKLSADIKSRLRIMESEFAPVIEMLTLAISAGETPIGSMHRIANRSRGILALEFAKVVREVRAGSSFSAALDSMGARSESVTIRRFVDALITAMNRGAPLVDVLQRHALEARTAQRNTLLALAGKAEISMMIPVVFLILPISVLFALWPSVTSLNLFAG